MIRKFDYNKDTLFLNRVLKSNNYTKYICENRSIRELEAREIFIFEHLKKPYGFIELYDISYYHKRVSVNICMCENYRMMNAIAMFQIVSFLFKEKKMHRISIKVKEENLHMRKMLNKYDVFLEGVYFANTNEVFYMYSILDYEYDLLKNKICRGKKE